MNSIYESGTNQFGTTGSCFSFGINICAFILSLGSSINPRSKPIFTWNLASYKPYKFTNTRSLPILLLTSLGKSTCSLPISLFTGLGTRKFPRTSYFAFRRRWEKQIPVRFEFLDNKTEPNWTVLIHKSTWTEPNPTECMRTETNQNEPTSPFSSLDVFLNIPFL